MRHISLVSEGKINAKVLNDIVGKRRRPISFCETIVIMSTFLYTLLGLTVGTSLHCAVRKEIDPCTCRKVEFSQSIFVTCERMKSFDQIVNALQNHFAAENPISLEITFSNLSDISVHNFQELKMSITNLKLMHDHLRDINDDTFLGLLKTDYLSLADNEIYAIPKGVLSRMPSLKSLDIGRGRITQILENDFTNSPSLQYLILPGNSITTIEKNSLPRTLRHLHLGRNQIPDLNGTLRHMSELEWLFINANQLRSLDEQLPEEVNKLVLIHASDNYLQRLPQEFKNLHRIESLFFEHNMLLGLDGTLSKARKLQRLVVSYNQIMTISADDFLEAESLEDLQLGYNNLTRINGFLQPLRALRCVNLTFNSLVEFSLQEIRGLLRLRVVDLSHNKISKLIGRMENVVEWETRVMDLRLDYNELDSLDGALSGLHGLLFLNLSHNHLSRISPDDLIGLEDLLMIDFSHNKLTTLDETSKTFLPALERLIASHNMLTELEHDFHGLPVLCYADLAYNNIRAISRDLVAHTRCNIHGSPAALRLNLQDNPILCDSALPELISDFEVNNTRLIGTSQCAPVQLRAVLPLSLSNNEEEKEQHVEIVTPNATHNAYIIAPAVESTKTEGDIDKLLNAVKTHSETQAQLHEAHELSDPHEKIIQETITIQTLLQTEEPKHVRTVD